MLNLDFSIKDLEWTEWRSVNTRSGIKKLRTAEIPKGNEFWNHWRKNGAQMKADGYSVGKYNSKWQINQWGSVDGAQAQQIKKEVKAAHQGYDDFAKEIASYDPDIEDHIILNRFKAIESKLLAWQPSSCKRIIAALISNKGCIDASDTGTGKTYTVLAAAWAMGLKPIIICPKAVIPSWKRACTFFGWGECDFFAINYEALKKNNPLGRWITEKRHKDYVWENIKKDNILIFDEAHVCKGQETLNAKLLKAAKGYYTCALSATLAKSPLDMRAIGHVLGLFNWPFFYDWVLRNGCVRDRYGLNYNGGTKGLLAIHKQIFPKRGTRVRIKDLGSAFPETQITCESFTLEDGDKINEIYNEMNMELAKLEAAGEASAANILVQQLRARQRQELVKVPLFCELAENEIAEGRSVAIFVNFNDTLEAISDRMKTQCLIRGGQTIEQRQKSIDDFQSGESNIIIVNIASGGVGVSLHALNEDSNPRTALISPSYSAVHLKQALGRVHRAGGKNSIQKIVFVANTIEDMVCERVKEKIKNINQINDGELAQALEF